MKNRSGVRILTVEDSPETQLILKGIFRGSAYHLVLCQDIQEAREKIRDNEFDIILIDINLPGENGLVLCKELQSERKTRQIPIFVISGNSDVSQVVKAFTSGADDYLVKPVNPRELKARVSAKLIKLNKLQEDWDVLDWDTLKKAS
jgi:DNA-binding response OmpR family regulator